MEAEPKKKKKKNIFWYKKSFFFSCPQKFPARARWLKRLWMVQATPWADFAVIGVQLCPTIIAIFPCMALSYKDCFLFRKIADCCRPQKRPMI